jgi:hypothetical protein
LFGRTTRTIVVNAAITDSLEEIRLIIHNTSVLKVIGHTKLLHSNALRQTLRLDFVSASAESNVLGADWRASSGIGCRGSRDWDAEGEAVWVCVSALVLREMWCRFEGAWRSLGV